MELILVKSQNQNELATSENQNHINQNYSNY